VYITDDSKLALQELQHHYVKTTDDEKNEKLFELLAALELNQAVQSSSPDEPFSKVKWSDI